MESHNHLQETTSMGSLRLFFLMNSAGVTLIKGDLMGIVRARGLSEATLKNIKQNLFFAFIYNSLGVPVGAMSLSSVSVIANALRLRRVKV